MIGAFEPARVLRSPHLQTILGSRGRGYWVRQRAAGLLAHTTQEILTTGAGIRLEAWLSRQQKPAPSIILIHGWLGHADSSYVLSAAAALWTRGFNVVRLNLRDHGNTAHLNEEMFHSARIDEVIEAIEYLIDLMPGPMGVAGFSLGGNFALRIARALGVETVAICPAIDPPASMLSIDSGSPIYRLFFLMKWQRALRDKEKAFPHRYAFKDARRLRTVSALTDLFVRNHTDFADTDAYLAAYSLTDSALTDTRATILYAADDPVIPAEAFDRLPASIELIPTRHGGHCAFINHPAAPTWADEYLVQHFETRFNF